MAQEHVAQTDAPQRTGSKDSVDVSAQHVEEPIPTRLSLWREAREWHRVVWYCFGLTSAILMYGYDYVIVGTTSAMPSFQHAFGRQLDGKWILPSLWLGLWTFASPGASIIGAVFGGFFQDWYGRKASIAVGSFLSAIGVAVCFVSNQSSDIDARRGIFLGGKAFQGLAIGMVLTTTQTYMSEVLPPRLRGPVLAFFPIFTLLGQLVGALVIYACMKASNGYIICFGSQWPFSAVPLLVAFIIPESPTYLVRKNKLEAAYKAQERLDPKHRDAQEAIAIIQRNIEHESQQHKATYADCFKGTNLRRTLLVMFGAAMPQLWGLTLLAKASYFAQVVGLSPNLSVLLLILGIVCGLLSNVASMWVLHRVGRRTLVLYGFAITGVLWTAMGISGIWDGTPTIAFTAVAMILVIVSAGTSVWPASYVISAETSSLQIRGKAQGIGFLTNGVTTAISGFALPYLFNADAANLKSKTGFVFGGICVIGWVASFYTLPEMKDRTPAEIDCMFEEKLPAKAFKQWTGSDHSMAKLDTRGSTL